MVAVAAGVFLAGLAAAFAALYSFERGLRPGGRCPARAAVGRTLRRLIAAGLLSGAGIGLLGLAGFIWGRETSPGAAAYAWAVLFTASSVLGWPALLVAGFLARVNTLRSLNRDE